MIRLMIRSFASGMLVVGIGGIVINGDAMTALTITAVALILMFITKEK
jgi:hypothetical protein